MIEYAHEAVSGRERAIKPRRKSIQRVTSRSETKRFSFALASSGQSMSWLSMVAASMLSPSGVGGPIAQIEDDQTEGDGIEFPREQSAGTSVAARLLP